MSARPTSAPARSTTVRTLKQHVLRALLDAPLVNGQQVAAASGVTRMAVSKAVASLRRDGFDIESHSGMGYGLRALSPNLTAAEVGARCTSPWWAEIEGAAVVGSTNDFALDAGRSGAEGPFAFVAGEQTAGRGRLGRTWHSQRGGGYVSIMVRPRTEALHVATLSLVSALAVARTLSSFDVPARVKWPNDVYAEGAKIAGILLESQASIDGVEFVVVGVGINVDPVTHGATSVARYATGSTAAQVVAAFLDEFAAMYATWHREGFAAFADEFAHLEINVGREVAVRNRAGEVLASGTCVGVDAHGNLVLEQPNGVLVPVASGEVTTR